MHGVIMAGGQGSRLMPLTLTRPKPMVEVLGRPVIDFVKEAMVDAGIDHLVVTTGYRGEQLAEHVRTWVSDGVEARVNQEHAPMGTAGSVGLLRGELTETFVVGSGDAIASFDIRALLKSHRANGAKVTMALWEVDDPTEFGIVGLSTGEHGEVDGQLRSGFIRRFLEKPTPQEAFSNVINAGLYILEPEVFEHVPPGEKFDFSKQLFPRLLELGWPMYAQTIDGVWFDVGQPSELLNAQKVLLEQHEDLPFRLPKTLLPKEGSLVPKHLEGHPGVHASVVGSGSSVAQDAAVSDSMLMADCTLEADVSVSNSILGQGVVVQQGSTVDRCVVGDGVVVPSGHHRNARIPN